MIIDPTNVRKHIYARTAVTLSRDVLLCSMYGNIASPTVTLLVASGVAGMIFVVNCEDNALSGKTVSVASADGSNMYVDDAAAASQIDMTAEGDYTILYSDGNNWYQLAGQQT